jgi:hypothetical protein
MIIRIIKKYGCSQRCILQMCKISLQSTLYFGLHIDDKIADFGMVNSTYFRTLKLCPVISS